MATLSVTDIVFNSDLESATVNSIFGEIEQFLNGTTASADITITGTMIADQFKTGTDGSGVGSGAYIMGAGDDAAVYFDGTDLIILTDGAGASGIILDSEDDTVEIKGSGTLQATFDTSGLNLASGDAYYINSNSVLSETVLGSGVVTSSLTTVGALNSLTIIGDLTVDTDTLKVDSTNNRIGVGISTPQFIFHAGTYENLLTFDGSSSTPNIESRIDSDTGGQEVAYSLGVDDDNNNRRVKFFLDDSTGIYGFDTKSSTGNDAEFAIKIAGSNKFFIADSGVVSVTDSFSVDTDTLYVDSTNDRVGINTSSPTSEFHVNLGTNENIRFGSAGSGDQRILAVNDAETNTVQMSIQADPLIFRGSGGVEVGRVVSDGIVVPNKVNFSDEETCSLYTETLTVNDDSAVSFSSRGISNGNRAVYILTSSFGNTVHGIFTCDASGLPIDLGTRGSDLDFSTSSLTGTTGTDGKVTVSTSGGTQISLENRVGSTRRFSLISFAT